MALVPTMRAGGAERVISLLLKQLDREQFEPQLTIVYDREISYPIPADVPIFVLDREPAPEGGPRRLDVPEELRARYASSVDWLGGVADKLGILVQREKPDIIITSPLWASILAIVAHDYFPASTRLINRVDAPPSVSLAQSDLQDLFTYFMRTHFNRSDRVVAVSRAVGRDLAENFGVDPDRIEVVNNPVDIERIHRLAAEPLDDPWFAEEIPIVLTVGRLERVKGIEHLFKALPGVLKTRPVRCVLVGEGSHGGYLRALAKHLGISDHVRFVGLQSNPFKYLRNATMFAMPSLSEGMPNVLLESMACGCPVIASDIKGGITREVLDEGAFGLIVPTEDSAALASAILRMLDDDELRQGFASRGVARAEEFDLPIVMRHNEEVLLSVASMPVGDVPRPTSAEPADAAGTSAARIRPGPEARPPAPRTPSMLNRAVSLARREGVRALAARAAYEVHRRAPGMPGFSAIRRDGAAPSRTGSDASGRRRVAILVPRMDDKYMGSGAPVLLETFDRSAYDVSLIRTVGGSDGYEAPSDVAQYYVTADLKAVPLPGVVSEQVTQAHGDTLRWMSGEADGLATLLHDIGADAVVAQGFYSSILATLAKERSGLDLTVVASMHSRAYDFANTAYGGDLYASLIRAHFATADAVIAPDPGIRKDLVEKFGIPDDKVVVIPDPVDARKAASRAQEPAEDFERPGAHPPFLCVIEKGDEDGLPYLLEALALARRDESVSCVIVGDGVWRKSAKALAEKLGLCAEVDFIGSHAHPWRLMHGAAALVRPAAHVESTIPSTIIDAVACRCPVISTSCSAALDEFFGRNERGVLVPMKDARALADALLQITWDPDARMGLVEQALQHLESVSAQEVVPRIEELVRESLPVRGGGSPEATHADGPAGPRA